MIEKLRMFAFSAAIRSGAFTTAPAAVLGRSGPADPFRVRLAFRRDHSMLWRP
jgi:hypothetical protein